MIQSSQVKYISLGILSLSCLGYYFNRFSQQQEHYKQKLQKFTAVYQQSQRSKNKSLDEIMVNESNNKQVKQKLFCFNNVTGNYNQSTFKLYQRERSIFLDTPKYSNSSILQHQMGGHFMFDSNHARIKCQLNDFNISGGLLKETQKTPIHLFKGINKVEPIVQSVVTSISFPLVSIYGRLYYDEGQLQWTIEPFFLTPYGTLKNIVEQYYKDKTHQGSLFKFAIFVGSLVIGYFTLIKPLISLYKKHISRIQHKNHIKENDLQYFKNKDYLMVRGESLLNCQHCKEKNVQIVYQCGHLAMCVDCHEKNLEKLCPLCAKKSSRFMKIFMS